MKSEPCINSIVIIIIIIIIYCCYCYFVGLMSLESNWILFYWMEMRWITIFPRIEDETKKMINSILRERIEKKVASFKNPSSFKSFLKTILIKHINKLNKTFWIKFNRKIGWNIRFEDEFKEPYRYSLRINIGSIFLGFLSLKMFNLETGCISDLRQQEKMILLLLLLLWMIQEARRCWRQLYNLIQMFILNKEISSSFVRYDFSLSDIRLYFVVVQWIDSKLHCKNVIFLFFFFFFYYNLPYTNIAQHNIIRPDGVSNITSQHWVKTISTWIVL